MNKNLKQRKKDVNYRTIDDLFKNRKRKLIQIVIIVITLFFILPFTESTGPLSGIDAARMIAIVIWIVLFVLLVLLSIRYIFDTNLEKQVNRYIAQKINSSANGLGSMKPISGGVFEQLIDKENLMVGPIFNGNVSDRVVRYYKIRAEYYPERRKYSSTYYYQVFDFELAKGMESLHVYVDGKENSKGFSLKTKAGMRVLRSTINHNRKVKLEGNFSDDFEMFVSKKSKFISLTTLTPDVMEKLQQFASDYDVEFIDNRVRLILDGNIKSADSVINNVESFLRILDNLPASTGLNTVKKQHYLDVRRPPVAL